MGSWGKTDNASNSVFYAPAQFNKTANSTNQTALFGNTTVGAIANNIAVGQFGVSAAEKANTGGESKKVTHAGWNLRTAGTGSIESITITAGGTGYSNNDTIRVAVSGTGTTNATGTVSTNSTGGITSVTITNRGKGFTAKNPTVVVANTTGGTANGTSATLVAVAGGRAGRVQYETLVAMGSITGDASDDTQLPE